MHRFLSRLQVPSYALLRIVSGLLFLCHGSQKLLDFPKAGPEEMTLVYTTAGVIELVGGALITLGLFTREAAFLASGLMAFAYWMAHGTKHWIPLMNGGELAVLYCFLFLYIAARGPGPWSLDEARKQGR